MPKLISSALKFILVTMNILTLLCGLALIGVGVWAQLDRNFMEGILETDLYKVTAYILIAAGGAIAVVSFLGCCGAKNEIKLMLIIYAFVTFIIFLLIIIAAVLAYIYSSEVKRKMPETMRKSIPAYGKVKGVATAWDATQIILGCCGLKEGTNQSYEIWKNNDRFQGEKVVPDSCCLKRDPDSIKACNKDPKNLTNNKDCFHAAQLYVSENAMILGALGFGSACIVVIGLILSCLLIFMI